MHKLTDSIYPVNPRVVTTQLPVSSVQALTVQPASWELAEQIWALSPLIVLVMVFSLLKSLFKPEVLKEVIPIAEKVAVAKAMGSAP